MLNYLRRGVGAKVLAGYFVTLLLLSFIGWQTFIQLTSLKNIYAESTGQLLTQENSVAAIDTQAHLTQHYATRYLASGALADQKNYEVSLNQLQKQLTDSFSQLENHQDTAPDKSSVEQDITNYKKTFDTVVRLTREQQQLESENFPVTERIIDNRINALSINLSTDAPANRLQALIDIQKSVQMMRYNIAAYRLDENESHLESIDKGYQQAHAAITDLERQNKNQTQMQNCGVLRTMLRNLYQDFQKFHDNTLALSDARSTLTRQESTMNLDIAALSADLKNTLPQTASQIQNQIADIQRQLNILILVVLALVIILMVFAWNSIVSPLRRLMGATQQIAAVDMPALLGQMSSLAQGNPARTLQITAHSPEIRSQDEIGQTAAAVDSLIAALHEAEQTAEATGAHFNEVAHAASLLGRGRLEVKLTPQSRDDLLGNAMLTMAENLRSARSADERQMLRLTMLRTIDTMIMSTTDLTTTLNFILQNLMAELKLEAANIFVRDPQTDYLQRIIHIGGSFDDKKTFRWGPDKSCAELVIKARTLARIDNVPDSHTHYNPLLPEDCGAYYGVPLMVQEEIYGVLQIFHPTPLKPDYEWIEFLQMIGSQAALAIASDHRLKKLDARLAEQTEKVDLQKETLAQLEQRLALYIQQMPVAVIECDKDLLITTWNAGAATLFGYSQEEALGHRAFELIVPKPERKQATQTWMDLLDVHEETRNTHENNTRDGKLLICEWRNIPLIDQGGKIIGITSLIYPRPPSPA